MVELWISRKKLYLNWKFLLSGSIALRCNYFVRSINIHENQTKF